MENEEKKEETTKEKNKNKDDEEYIALESDSKQKNKSYKKKQENKNKTIIYILIAIIIILLISLGLVIILLIKSNKKKRIIREIIVDDEKSMTVKKEKEYNNNNHDNDNKDLCPDNQISDDKKKIYVKYMDFWPAFVLERFDVHKILCEKYRVMASNNPDYVIFGQFGGGNYGIENKINCVKLFLTIENRDPNFDNTDYAIGIHYIVNGDRYFRKPTETHQLTAIQTVYNATQVNNIDISSKKFCAWVVSNGGGSVRNAFFDRLSQYKRVDSGGRFRNNVGGAVGNKKEFLSHYKFSICFENSKTQGYISEKLVDAFEAGTIPIYYGDDTVAELLNSRSYIHVRDEKDFDEKIELIKKIDNNVTLYQEIIREKIVIDDTRYAKEVQKYKDFIYHIIEQDKEKAKRFKRRNDSFNNNEN